MTAAVMLDWHQFAEMYCDRQEQTKGGLLAILKAQRDKYQPLGWFMAECQDMSSSYMGSLVILPYGPNNTFKNVPEAGKCFSPRGLASDQSTAVAYMEVASLPK